MVKRPFNQANVEGQDRRPGNTPKRQKKDDSAPSKGLAPENITSARQVQGLFADYSNAAKIQAGIQSFKKFLAECRDLQHALHIDEEVKLCVLQEYLESQLSKDGDETCGDLMQAWSFASQSNNFQLLSSVPTVLHLLLRTISLFPTWKKHGTALAKSVLQPPYLKLIYRSLGGSKDAITSPCLRLLTEINKFDNGSLCPLLHQSLDFTVKDLARNLEPKKTEKLDHVPVEDPDRPSVRTVFVKFIISFFRYGTNNIKTDIMGLRTFTTPLFKYIRQDTAAVIDEVLTAFGDCIMADHDILRSTKTNYFNDWSLSRLAELCYRDDPIDPEKPDRTVVDVAFEFLGRVCTTPGNGVCFKDNGWYTGSRSDASSEKTGKQQVNNRILLGLLKSLRPHSNTYHLRLLVAVFTAAPELVAAYFNDNTAFTFDPKLTATWIGLSSVLLETIQIPVPANFGYSGNDGVPSAPPPVRNTIENILPQQVNRTVLTKCLGFNNNFVRFIAIRILNAAFAKLSAVLERMGQLADELVDGSVWAKGVYDLVDEFSKKVPEIGTVVGAFNQMKEDAELQREAGSRLLRNYYEYLPSAVGAVSAGSGGGKGGFDFGPAFARVLVKIGESKGFEALEVKHCLHLAKLLPETRWWAKAAAAKYSPAITLMKVFTEGKGGERMSDVYGLVEKIVDDSPLFGKCGVERSGVHPLEALMESFEWVKEKEGWERVLGYLDNACGRLVQGPYKYYDIVGEAMAKNEGGAGLSPLLAALFHQFNFLKKDEEKREDLEALSKWLLAVANNFWVIGEMPLVEKYGQDIAKKEAGDSSEVFAQFVGGVKAWRQYLEEFKIGIAGSSTNMLGFPLQFDFPEPGSLSASGLQDIGKKYQYLQTLMEAVDTRPAVVTLFYWKWIQYLVEMLSQITVDINESLLGGVERKQWEELHDTFFGAYEDAARKLLQNEAYEPESRSKKCLDFMVTTDGVPLYLEYFANEKQRLMARCDKALITVYSLLPIGSLSNGGLKPHLFDKFAEISPAAYTANPSLVTNLTIFLKQILDVNDLKKCCRDAYIIELPGFAWSIIFERLYESKETLAGDEVWEVVCGDRGVQEHPWSKFMGLVRRESSAELQSFFVGFEVLYKVVVEKSAAGVSSLLLMILQNKGFTNGVERLLNIVSQCLGGISNVSPKDTANLAFPVCKAVKNFAMERDDSTGRLRWKKRDLKQGDDMQVDEDWKEKFIQMFYLNTTPGASSTPLHQEILDDPTLRHADCTEYFEIGLDFGVIPWNERVLDLLRLDDNPAKDASPLLPASTFPLFETAYRLSQGTDMSWFHTKLQKMVYTLTVELSKPKISQEDSELLDTLEHFGNFIERNEVDLLDYVAKDAVDSLLEVVFGKLGTGGGVVTFAAGVVAGIEDVKYLQHSKLLQLILTTSTSLSSLPRNPERKEETYRLAYILRRLFFASKAQHSNVTTLDGVLSIYSGTNDVVDAVLVEILISIEGYMERSILERITTVGVTDDESKRLVERDSKGHLKVVVCTKVVGRSLDSFSKRKIEFKGIGEGVKRFLERCRKVDEEDEEGMRGKTYDVGFLAGLVMNGVLTEKEEQKIDVKDVIEKGLLGVVIMALSSGNGEERGMAEAVLTTIVGKLEGTTGGGRGYKERTEVMHILCKLLAGIAVLEDAGNGLKDNGIPTITALLLARMVGVAANPGHFLYEKVMTWLQSRATVDITEIPMLKEFLRSEGEGYWKEVLWMLESLAGGMKSAVDMEVCRRRGVFEETLGLYSSSASSHFTGGGKGKEDAVRKKILELLWNAAGVEGGATTLITRTGVVSWIKMMVCAADAEEERVTLKRLAARLWEGCDKGYVKQWSEGNIGRVLESLVML